jgi:hypothetical protein
MRTADWDFDMPAVDVDCTADVSDILTTFITQVLEGGERKGVRNVSNAVNKYMVSSHRIPISKRQTRIFSR